MNKKWWTARNEQGRVGSIPVPYVEGNHSNNIYGVLHFDLATSAPRQSSQRHSNPNPQNFPSQRGSDSRPNSLPGKIKFS